MGPEISGIREILEILSGIRPVRSPPQAEILGDLIGIRARRRREIWVFLAA